MTNGLICLTLVHCFISHCVNGIRGVQETFGEADAQSSQGVTWNFLKWPVITIEIECVHRMLSCGHLIQIYITLLNNWVSKSRASLLETVSQIPNRILFWAGKELQNVLRNLTVHCRQLMRTKSLKKKKKKACPSGPRSVQFTAKMHTVCSRRSHGYSWEYLDKPPTFS